ncbi:unnamed protein product [Lactuca saligna]|uniref:Uncharacterized protein n=1 Tax=Lactuca saligna TaxID=75948 RepID=A0AA35YVD2_LACSI|nr:unnamed protein product [Lactuca saligna]
MIQNHQTLQHLSFSGLSVITQLSSQGIDPDAFSHCLVGNGGGGGILVLDQIIEPTMVYTPLIQSQTTNDWDDYSRYVNPDGVDLSHGIYGHGYAPYGPYSPDVSPMPTVGQYGELYGAQHYQYPTSYFPPMTPTTPYSPTPPKGEITTTKEEHALSFDTTKGNPNGVKRNTASTPVRPTSYQNLSFNPNGTYRRGFCCLQPQVEVKSFPAEAINPLACNTDGTYIVVGGGVSGHIYLWGVATSRLLKKWHRRYRPVTCLVFSNDQSLLISGSEDGTVRVWSLLIFTGHALPVTDIVKGYGGSNAIILSVSLDRTCKLHQIQGNMFFYAGGRDGKIYIAELNAQVTSNNNNNNNNNNYGLHIIGTSKHYFKVQSRK